MPTADQALALMRAADLCVTGESDAVLEEAQVMLGRAVEVRDWWVLDRLGAFALLHPHGAFDVEVDRDHAELWDTVLEWVVARGGVETSSRDADSERLDALHRHGWVDAYSAFDLKRPFAPVDQDPAFQAWHPEDGPAVHDCIYSVWDTVEGHVVRPYDEWRSLFVDHPGFDPALQVLVRSDQGIEAAALCRIWEDGLGWVSQLAVAAGAQGRGLGRAVLTEAVRRLQGAGAGEVGLSVNAPNAGALALYESLGFVRTAAWVSSRRG